MNRVVRQSYISIEKSNYTTVWGNKFFNLENYIKEKKLSSVGFCEQFHSNILLESTDGTGPKCDAIFTSKKNHALIIKTADCVPILVKHKDNIFALHAGWRGLCDEIILNLLRFEPDENTKAYIGPHIGANSYEVGPEVIDKIIKKNDQLRQAQADFVKPVNEKFFLNLNRLATLQLTQVGILEANILSENIDTLTDHNWNSYRRDQAEAGRNLSLIFQH